MSALLQDRPTTTIPAAAAAPLLEVRDLIIAYRDHSGQEQRVVHGLSFSIAPGEVVALVGESGSGKTTTAQAVIGLLADNGRREQGSIRLQGTEVSGWSAARWNSIRGRVLSLVPQDPTNNRKVWAKLEADVRKYAQRAAGDVFVFSGPLYQNAPHLLGASQVWVPDHLFKLVYDASSQRAWAYVLPNSADAQISRPMDYAHFVVQTQWHLLAGLPVTDSAR